MENVACQLTERFIKGKIRLLSGEVHYADD